mgnify:CR=1 FL=1
MATSYYDIGTITLTNGSKSVVGNGTAWQMALITGGNIFVQAPGNPLPIDTVDADNAITAELQWTGASGTYEYRLQRDSAYMKALDENSRNLAYLLSETRNGTLFKYDLAGPLANLPIHDGKPKGFSYLVLEGEAAQLYVKASDTEGDWSGPFAYGTGPVGPEGPVGFLDFQGEYNPATAYVANDGVRYNGSSWVALQATTGNAPPTLPTTENAYWSLLAVKGQDGSGVGDMVAATYDPRAKAADAFDSANHDYDNAVSELAADTVQAAIDELASQEISNVRLADMTQATVKGRASGAGTGEPDDLDAAALFAILGAQVPARPQAASGVGQFIFVSTAAGDGYSLPAGGTWVWFLISVVVAQGLTQVTRSGGGVAAGGTTVLPGFSGEGKLGFAWRIA